LNAHYQKSAGVFRDAGLHVEVMLEKKKLKAQFQTAEKKGVTLAVICGEDEAKTCTVNLRDLITRENFERLSPEAAVEKAKELLR
jgi:histidyl-tRNA synthetase